MYQDGGRAEGECVNGLMQGAWLRTRPDGTRLERQYVDGKLFGEKVDVASGGSLHRRLCCVIPDGCQQPSPHLAKMFGSDVRQRNSFATSWSPHHQNTSIPYLTHGRVGLGFKLMLSAFDRLIAPNHQSPSFSISCCQIPARQSARLETATNRTQ